uniref:C2 domain-containing protein n=1 Tax=Cajanus cajan TaxID=3821 RepID=A0A151SAE2_CAJCA|nr:hypothetical protein KK1_026397 [Cajanus cajan]
MNSFNQSHQTTSFRYNPKSNTMNHADDDDTEFSGILDIYVHHARNIHNICIYDNQDVYAKFSLTYNPDETLSTKIINGGGKNPIFNENLRMNITHMDAVLKCEIWMFSRSRNHLEDQLLGFALVQISQVVGKGKVTEDYSLSSTDLFHCPAGTVQLTLSLDTSFSISSTVNHISQSATTSSISSEVVLLDQKISQDMSNPVEYSRIEFPDVNVMKENQKMVSEYFNLEPYGSSVSRPNSNCVFSSSTTTSLSDDRNSSDSVNEKSNLRVDSSTSFNVSITVEGEAARFGQVFSAPLGNINMEAEQSAMQQQIVDMYMRSMQQFTESLAKMKLPMDLDKPESVSHGDVIQNHNSNKLEIDKKKDGSRVFYGSRAFF